jgi:hypothetical protein
MICALKIASPRKTVDAFMRPTLAEWTCRKKLPNIEDTEMCSK